MLHRLALKYRVFLWVSLAVALPMALLIASAVKYGEGIYAKEVDVDMYVALDRTVAAIDRRLFIEHDLIRALSQVPAVRALLPSLGAMYEGDPLDEIEFAEKLDLAARFFETFQGVRRSLGTVRILNRAGDTLVKVRDGQPVPPVFEHLGDVAIIENGSEIPSFREEVAGLRVFDVGSLTSPPGFEAADPALNTALPLLYNNGVVGYVLIGPPLEPLNRTLDISARPRGAKLLVAEINPDNPDRNGMLLYADMPHTSFTTPGDRPVVADVEPRLLEEGGSNIGQKFEDDQGAVWYFRQYSPYPDRLVAWLFAYRLEPSASLTPFWFADYVVWAAGILALGVGLLIATFAAYQVTRPVSDLAQRLTRFAEGEREDRIAPSGAPELREAHQAFNYMADTFEELERERAQTQRAMLQNAKLTSIGQLAAGIAHELRNPLANIYSLTKLAQRAVPEGEEQLTDDLNNIRGEAERASDIIQGLLDFSRQGPTRQSEFSLADWLQECVQLVMRMAEQREISLELAEVADIRLHGDQGLLQQAVVNVLINALQASPPRSVVRVSTEMGAVFVQIAIQDKGAGIPAGILDRLFDPFFTTKPEGEGTGLGLSIALGIVEKHQGRLVLENGPDGGTVARILLPLQPTHEGASAAP
ncbi:MAG: HAMP domain-containing histidine kinase [Gammaproteobacteria bacterium]|nr:HAMP domain-containing histidine kinase [Gammaproteobacteria bacterium]